MTNKKLRCRTLPSSNQKRKNDAIFPVEAPIQKQPKKRYRTTTHSMRRKRSYRDDDPERVVGEQRGTEEQQQKPDCPVSELHAYNFFLAKSTLHDHAIARPTDDCRQRPKKSTCRGNRGGRWSSDAERGRCATFAANPNPNPNGCSHYTYGEFLLVESRPMT